MKTGTRLAVLGLLTASHCCQVSAQSLSGTVNSYYQVTAVNTAANVVTVDNASGLSVGQRVFLYQAKGASITATNTSGYGDITALNNAGSYEFNTICSITGNDVWLLNAMVNAYVAAGQVQLITVPSSSSLTVAAPVTALPWDPSTGKGGIVVLESTGTLTLNANIDVSGQGFEGGALVNYPVPPYNCSWAVTVSDYYLPLPANGFYTGGKKGEGIAAYILNEEYARGKLANGGGGGDNGNSGGGGGGNYGAGGAGGQRSGETTFDCHAQYPGIGGASLAAYGYTTSANKIFFGGGGGSGEENNGAGEPGGNGGGMIFLSAQTIIGGGGNVLAKGLQPQNPINTDPYQAEGDGGGGGGAGGTIILNATTITGAITADASGANGSNASNFVNDCTGPGGGGGGGMVWASGPGFPAVVTPTVNGGANGIVSLGNSKVACRGASNGAASGAAGLNLAGYQVPLSSGPVCVDLASPVLKYFTAVRSNQDVRLTWALVSSAVAVDVRRFILQRSSDLSHFSTLATIPVDTMDFNYTDPGVTIEGTVVYRLAWQNANGDWSYSRILAVAGQPGPDAGSIRLYPDPATNYLTVNLVSETPGPASVSVLNGLGRSLFSQQLSLFKGLNTVSVPLGTLPPATYFLVIESQGRRLVKPFLKKNG